MTLPRYPAYKDSGVEWLGEVPVHWNVFKLKRCVSLLTEKTNRRSNPIGLENIEGWSGRFVPTDSDFQGEGVAFAPGDVLFGKLRPYLAKAMVADKLGEAVGDFHVMRPRRGTGGEFLAYQIRTQQFVSIVDGSTYGAKMPRVSWEFMGGMPFSLPPEEEQAHITVFLDHETSKIDALIAEQQNLIALLKEKRQAVISHAVTKGLSPDVPMKDSGVEWLGEVPEHWEVLPLPRAIKFQEGPGIMASEFRDEGIPLLRVSGVQSRWASLDGCNHLDPDLVAKRWRHFQLNQGDLLISASASMGMTSEVGRETVGAVPYTGLIRINPVEGVSTKQFVRYFLASDFFYVQIDLLKSGSTIQHFGPTHLRQMKMVIPPCEEQEEIARYLESQEGQLTAMTVEAEHAVNLLSERRSALISAAVTGKIDVRNLVSQEAA